MIKTSSAKAKTKASNTQIDTHVEVSIHANNDPLTQKATKPIRDMNELNKRDTTEWNMLRPTNIKDYIGQAKIVSQLELILKSARIREAIPEHILFYGQPGLGKTTLATLIANELNLELRIISAPTLKKVGDLVSLLINMEQPSVIFIDEIHRLRTEVEETLYSAMEDKKIDIIIGKGQGLSTVRMDLQPFILIGATTQIGKISKPLRDRFPTTFKMETYNHEEMIQLIDRNVTILGIEMDIGAKELVVTRARGVPRIANNILKRFVDLQVVNAIKSVSDDTATEFMTQLGIFELGMTKTDLDYLKALKNISLSLKTLSGILLEESDTIEYVMEPWLIHNGFIDKDSSGRKLTLKGREFINKILGKEEYSLI